MSATNPVFYSKAELARHFRVPESTIRFYCSRFAPFLPAEGEGRKRRYGASCLDVLSFIRECLPQVRTSAAMERLLAGRLPICAAEAAPFPPEKAINFVPWPESTIPRRFERCLPPENFPGESPSAPTQNSVPLPGLLQKQNDVLERIAASLAVMAEKASGRPETPPEWEELRAEVRDLRLLLAAAEKTQQQDTDQLRAWIMRLARK
jgi:DNA-binding transcriptional MerR regulator